MKKLRKLKLNPEKMLRNEELVNFKWGSGRGGCHYNELWCGFAEYQCTCPYGG